MSGARGFEFGCSFAHAHSLTGLVRVRSAVAVAPFFIIEYTLYIICIYIVHTVYTVYTMTNTQNTLYIAYNV